MLLLLSELDAVVEFEGEGLESSACQPLGVLLPYDDLGAELDRGVELSLAEVGVAVEARTGRGFSTGVL